jgi:hypothetical protein
VTLGEQGRVLVASIAAPRFIRARTALWLIALSLVSVVIVMLTARATLAGEGAFIDWMLHYVLPERWVDLGRMLIELFATRQLASVENNAVLGGSLLLLSVVLLPLRERISVAFERERALTDTPFENDGPLQLIGEILISTLVFVTVQLSLFALGYSRDPARRALASVLSYVFLFASTALELVPSLLARHGLRFSSCVLALARVPLLSLLFGAAFAAPGLLATYLWNGGTSSERLVAVVAANVIGVAWGTLGGTVAAARLLPEARAWPVPSLRVRAISWAFLLGLFAWQSVLATGAALSVERKLQLLKCHFHVVVSSVKVDLPDAAALLRGQLSTTVRATIEIENPSAHDVAFEATRLEIARGGTLVAQVALNPGAIPAGETARYPIVAPIVLGIGDLRHALTQTGKWDLTLYVEVAAGVELPVYLTDAP